MFAFLNNDDEACRTVYTIEQQRKIAELTGRMHAIEATLQHRTPDWQEKMAAWENGVRDDQPQWAVLELEHIGEKSQRYIHQKDGSLLAQGYAPTKFSQVFEGKTDLHKVTAFRLELLNDPDLPCNGPGRSIKGTCALSEFSVEVSAAGAADEKDEDQILRRQFRL